MRDIYAAKNAARLGPVLREEMRFENGRMLNADFRGYLVPRIADLPELDIHLLDRPDLPSVGGGETPIVAVAPAVANGLSGHRQARARTADSIAGIVAQAACLFASQPVGV